MNLSQLKISLNLEVLKKALTENKNNLASAYAYLEMDENIEVS